MTAVHRMPGVVIYRAVRLNNSKNGNPQYRFDTSAGPLLMHEDSAMGYAVPNWIYSDSDPRRQDPARHFIGHYLSIKVTLLCTPQRRVWGVELNGTELMA